MGAPDVRVIDQDGKVLLETSVATGPDAILKALNRCCGRAALWQEFRRLYDVVVAFARHAALATHEQPLGPR
jgi:hypothetical protein